MFVTCVHYHKRCTRLAAFDITKQLQRRQPPGQHAAPVNLALLFAAGSQFITDPNNLDSFQYTVS
jgi:hypothetical protein